MRLAAGELLNKAKEATPKNEWLTWLAAKLGVTISSVYLTTC
jgi:hypothetical protein